MPHFFLLMVKLWENVCGRGWCVRFFVCFCSCEAWRRDIRMNMSGRGARRGGGLLMQKEQKGQSEDRSVVRKTRGGRGGGISVARKVRGGLMGGRNAGGFYRRPKGDKIFTCEFIVRSVCDKIGSC